MPTRRRESGRGALLVTGGTGFLGGRLLEQLAAWDRPILALVRDGSEARLESLRTRIEAVRPGAASRIERVRGDVVLPDLGLSSADRRRVVGSVDEIFHLAALNDPGAPREVLTSVNLHGTDHILELARGIRRLRRFHFVSSFEVSGDYEHTFYEDQLFVNQRFASNRALSKFRAEAAVRKNAALLPVTIYRPGAIVGDSKTGEMPRLDGPYLVFEALRRLHRLASVIPLFGPGGDHFVQMVPVDFVATAIAAIALRERRRGTCFTLTDPRPPTYFELSGMICERMGLRRPRFGLPLRPLRRALAVPFAARALGRVLEATGIPSGVLEYLHPGALHDSTNTETILAGTGISCPRVADYLDRIWDHYVTHLAPR